DFRKDVICFEIPKSKRVEIPKTKRKIGPRTFLKMLKERNVDMTLTLMKIMMLICKKKKSILQAQTEGITNNCNSFRGQPVFRHHSRKKLIKVDPYAYINSVEKAFQGEPEKYEAFLELFTSAVDAKFNILSSLFLYF
ncbi:unnamed protein product, partial [Arabidopsis lyrata]